jgi:orotate phosphoribosyltransferase-like protein
LTGSAWCAPKKGKQNEQKRIRQGRVGKDFAEVIGDAAKVLPPKAFSGSSIKSSVPALEAFVSERMASK